MKMLRAIREFGGTAPARPQPSVTQDTAEPFRDLVNAAKLPWRIERNQPLDLSFAALRQSGLNLLPHNEISETPGPSAMGGTTGRVCPRLRRVPGGPLMSDARIERDPTTGRGDGDCACRARIPRLHKWAHLVGLP
jgi:hypothetical protein